MDWKRSAEEGASRRRSKGHKFEDLKDRSARTRGDEVEYFKFDGVCLGCGAKIRAKVTMLAEKLRCPKCKTLMHIGADGEWHFGPPPEQKDPAKWLLGTDQRYWVWRDLTRAFPLLRSRVFLITIAALLLCTTGIATARWAFVVLLPDTLQGRAVFLCDALLENHRSNYRRCVSPETIRDGTAVYEEIQSRLLRKSGPLPPNFNLEVVYEHAERGSGCTVAEFFCTRERGDESEPVRKFERNTLATVSLYWTATSDGEWLLDAKRTADGFSRGR